MHADELRDASSQVEAYMNFRVTRGPSDGPLVVCRTFRPRFVLTTDNLAEPTAALLRLAETHGVRGQTPAHRRATAVATRAAKA